MLRYRDMRAVRFHRSVKLNIFLHPGSQDIIIQVGFGTQVAKTTIYPVICRLPLFVVLCYHNRRSTNIRQTRQKNVMFIAIGATCCMHYMLCILH